MEKIGNHERVWHYDGAFKCMECHAQWGALGTPQPQMPERCVIARTALAKKLRECREAYIASGGKLSSIDEILAELGR